MNNFRKRIETLLFMMFQTNSRAMLKGVAIVAVGLIVIAVMRFIDHDYKGDLKDDLKDDATGICFRIKCRACQTRQ